MLQVLSLIGLIIYFGVLLLVVLKEKKNTNIIDYFFAGRTLPFWSLSITFIASWWGAGSAISTADLAFSDGLGAFWYYGMPVLLSTFLMIIFSKAIRRVSFLTQSEIMKERYSPLIGMFISVFILIFMTFSIASQMVGIGTFFGSYLHMDYTTSILLGTSIVLVYSVFGGFRGVVLTDTIQFILLVISAIIVFFVALKNAGSIENIINVANEQGKSDFTNVLSGAQKYLPYVITFGCSWMIQANVWQRISATKNDIDAKKMTVTSFFAYIPLYLIVVLTGMASITMFDELPEGGIVSAIVVGYMPPILGALVFVGISAAIMSTMDSLINTASMTIVLDLDTKNRTDKEKLKLSRYATIFVTVVGLLISIKIQSILDISFIASDIITTGVFVPLILGFIFKKGNTNGALASMVFGVVFSGYNLLCRFINLPTFFEQQSALQVVVGVTGSLILYVLFSILTHDKNDKKSEVFIKKAKLIKLK